MDLSIPMQNESPEPTESQGRPWEAYGCVRRDCEPHRGPSLRLLSRIALLLGVCSIPACILLLPALVALGAGGTAYTLARQDLLLMEQRLMDPEGGVQTAEAKANAGNAIVLALLSMVCFGILMPYKLTTFD